ncbi:hypothetical protein EDD17DRAFT_1900712 [Pisolithus thermaeus]|nr:hypothetical protein EDD17DRAFT_1900712 [Pisolithus thermaeus]
MGPDTDTYVPISALQTKPACQIVLCELPAKKKPSEHSTVVISQLCGIEWTYRPVNRERHRSAWPRGTKVMWRSGRKVGFLEFDDTRLGRLSLGACMRRGSVQRDYMLPGIINAILASSRCIYQGSGRADKNQESVVVVWVTTGLAGSADNGGGGNPVEHWKISITRQKNGGAAERDDYVHEEDLVASTRHGELRVNTLWEGSDSDWFRSVDTRQLSPGSSSGA